MADHKIIGYKKIFGFILPDWVDESLIRLTVTLLLSSAVMLFVLVFVVWPKFSEITSMKATLKAQEESLASLKNSKTGFDKLSEQIPESTQDIVLSAIPQDYSPESAIFLLRKISVEIPGVSIVSYKLPEGVLFDSAASASAGVKSTDKSMVSYAAYPVKLSVTAPVSSLLDFIDRVERSLPFGVVSDLNIQEVSRLAGSTPTKSVQMEIEVTYYQAKLKQVDISKIQLISEADLSLVQKISGFSRLDAANDSLNLIAPANTNSGASLFGF